MIIASINYGRLNKIRVKSKMSRNEKKGHGGKHTRPKKWSGARRPAGPATTALCEMDKLFINQYGQIVLQISSLSEGSTGQIFATSSVIYQIKMWGLKFLKVADDTFDSEYQPSYLPLNYPTHFDHIIRGYDH